jgi:hypothetical protein
LFIELVFQTLKLKLSKIDCLVIKEINLINVLLKAAKHFLKEDSLQND